MTRGQKKIHVTFMSGKLKFGYIDDKNFTNLLGVLSGVGLVEKADEKYKIVDPLLREALRS